MRIEDNFLDTIYFDFLHNKLLDNNFPWYFQNSKVVDNDNENQFTHLFFDMSKQTSNHVNIIEPLLKRLEVNEVFKAKVNFTHKQNSIRPYLYHVDIDYAKGIQQYYI